MAKAVHGSGIPILTVDRSSTPTETACQLALVAYWHGYLTGDEPELPGLLAAAYPDAIRRIKRKAGLDNSETAVALLLNRLLHPGFDPVRGTNSARHYINVIARAVTPRAPQIRGRGVPSVGNARPEREALLQAAVTLRPKAGRRYQLDDTVQLRIREHVEAGEQRRAAIQLLVMRGFSVPAARKWAQRHRMSTISATHPSPRRRGNQVVRQGVA